jgi:hypothetical protein
MKSLLSQPEHSLLANKIATKVEPLNLAATVSASDKTKLKDGEHFDIPIAAQTGFRVRVWVNYMPAQVISSIWTIPGRQADINSIRQDLNLGFANVFPGTVLNGNPDNIETIWIEEGTFRIQVACDCIFEGAPFSTTVNGSVTVHAPQFDTTQAQIEISGPNVNPTEDALGIWFEPGIVRYTCDQTVQGGEVGFLVRISGLRQRGGLNEVPVQEAGMTGGAFHSLQANDADWQGEIALDTNFFGCGLQGSAFHWYRLGSPSDTYERYTVHLVYRAALSPGITRAFFGIKSGLCWKFAADAHRFNDDWSAMTYGRDNDNAWPAANWGFPDWTGNYFDAYQWRPLP